MSKGPQDKDAGNVTASDVAAALDGAEPVEDQEDGQEKPAPPPLPPTLANTTDAFLEELEARRSGKRRGVSTGLVGLDAMLDGGLRQGLYLLAAPPGAGKTTLALQIAAHVARGNPDAGVPPRPVLFVALEMPRWDLETRLIAARLGWAWPKVRGAEHLDDQEAAAVLKVRDALATELPLLELVEGAHGYMTADGLEAELARLSPLDPVTKAPKVEIPPLVVVDYLQAIAPDTSWVGDRRNAVGHNAYRLKTLSTVYRVPVLALSSVARDWYGKADADKPSSPLGYLAAGKESGDAEFATDVMLYLDMDEPAPTLDGPAVEAECRIVVAKNRGGDRGFVGPIQYHGARGTFRESGSRSYSSGEMLGGKK